MKTGCFYIFLINAGKQVEQPMMEQAAIDNNMPEIFCTWKKVRSNRDQDIDPMIPISSPLISANPFKRPIAE